MRIGAAYYHMSNGKALDQAENPGADIVGPTISVPFRQVVGPHAGDEAPATIIDLLNRPEMKP
jgi:hypothetical protein